MPKHKHTAIWIIAMIFMVSGSFSPALANDRVVRAAEVPPLPDDVVRLVRRAGGGLSRYVISPEFVAAADQRVDLERLAVAVKDSEAWIRAVLRPEFVPKNIERGIQGVASGLEATRNDGSVIERARYDCTTIAFEADEYRFDVVQDSLSVKFFLSPLAPNDNAISNDSKALGEFLVSETQKYFNHAQIGFYVRAIRLNDFGVDLASPMEAWFTEESRWRTNTMAPPQSCVDGLQEPMSELLFTGSERVGARMRELDPTLPQSVRLDDVVRQWWANVYAATDGRVLVYSVAKTGGGQRPGSILVPDWFRVLDDEDEVAGESKQTMSRPREPRSPPR